VFDVIGGDIQKRSAGLVRAGGTLVSIVGPTEARPADGASPGVGSTVQLACALLNTAIGIMSRIFLIAAADRPCRI
jgi:hypothetical protein